MRRMVVWRPWRRRWALVLAAAIMATSAAAIAVPQAASAANAPWVTRTFSVSYDGHGMVSYSAQGISGDTGCKVTANELLDYGFDQLWTVVVKFKNLGKGKYETKIVSAHHVSGPESAGDTSTLQGQQVQLKNENCAEGTIDPDVGKFDCTSKSMKLMAFPNPQMEIRRSGANLVLLGDAFLDGTLKYTGKDTIPYDAKYLKGCARYDSDITYGSDIVPGIEATAKIALPVAKLAVLGKGKFIDVNVALGKNTQLARQNTCDSVWAKPNTCVIYKQSLAGKFKLGRVK
ncbi:hypothetical protein EAS64_29250 [Trebonia kvetii]|uniref:Uncharacterized protein n=1 Tax=Trebonia kvetii TaxID=2480626 RepID=A0A6P2BRU2_9ACTN|nr:hypothetical protein [Trebonia kvetii]TVZ01578.1 hypothetical protein EAS64_29250 [Trebonia kvetii]